MKRVRLQVALLPWIQPASQSSSSGRNGQEPLKPWLHVCSEDITLQELADQIVLKFARIYAGFGDLTIRHLESDYGEILDLTDIVSDVFDDRAPSGESRTSIVRVASFAPDVQKLRTSVRFGSLMPESSARPTKRSLSYVSPASIAIPTTELGSSQGSSTTVGRVVKRQKRNTSKYSPCIGESELGEMPSSPPIGMDEVSVQVRGSQQRPRWESPDLLGSPSLHPLRQPTHEPIFYKATAQDTIVREKSASAGHNFTPPRASKIRQDVHDSSVQSARPSTRQDIRPEIFEFAQPVERQVTDVQSQAAKPQSLSSSRSGSPRALSVVPANEASYQYSKSSAMSRGKPDPVYPDSAALTQISNTQHDASDPQRLRQRTHSGASSAKKRDEGGLIPTQQLRSVEGSDAKAQSMERSADVGTSPDKTKINVEAQDRNANEHVDESAGGEAMVNVDAHDAETTESDPEELPSAATYKEACFEATPSDDVLTKETVDSRSGADEKWAKVLEGRLAAESFLAVQTTKGRSEEVSTPKSDAASSTDTICNTDATDAIETAPTADLLTVANVAAISGASPQPISESVSLRTMTDIPSENLSESDAEIDSTSEVSLTSSDDSDRTKARARMTSEEKEMERKSLRYSFPGYILPPDKRIGSPPDQALLDYIRRRGSPVYGDTLPKEYLKSLSRSDQALFGYNDFSNGYESPASNSTPDRSRYPRFSEIKSSPTTPLSQKLLPQASEKAPLEGNGPQADDEDTDSESEASTETSKGSWKSGMTGLYKLAKMSRKASS